MPRAAAGRLAQRTADMIVIADTYNRHRGVANQAEIVLLERETGLEPATLGLEGRCLQGHSFRRSQLFV